MPTYQYRCKDCDTDLEVVQKFTDDALTDCPVCEDGTLRKVFNAVGVVFKGSGFYRTDSRKAGSTDSGAKTNGAAKTTTSSSGGTESKPSGDSASKNPAPASVGTAG